MSPSKNSLGKRRGIKRPRTTSVAARRSISASRRMRKNPLGCNEARLEFNGGDVRFPEPHGLTVDGPRREQLVIVGTPINDDAQSRMPTRASTRPETAYSMTEMLQTWNEISRLLATAYFRNKDGNLEAEPSLERGSVRRVLDISPWAGLDIDEHMSRLAAYARRLDETYRGYNTDHGLVTFPAGALGTLQALVSQHFSALPYFRGVCGILNAPRAVPLMMMRCARSRRTARSSDQLIYQTANESPTWASVPSVEEAPWVASRIFSAFACRGVPSSPTTRLVASWNPAAS